MAENNFKQTQNDPDTDENIFISEIIKEGPKNFSVSNTAGILDKKTCFAAINNLANKHKISNQDAFVAAAMLCLKGGTSANAQNTLNVITPDGKIITLGDFKLALSTAQKNASIRRWARGMADNINEIASLYDQVGNLAKAIRREYPDISKADLYYCSDFNTENPNVSPQIREVLITDSKRRFNR